MQSGNPNDPHGGQMPPQNFMMGQNQPSGINNSAGGGHYGPPPGQGDQQMRSGSSGRFAG